MDKKKKDSIKFVPEKLQNAGERDFFGLKLSRLKSKIIVRSIILNVFSIILIVVTLSLAKTLDGGAAKVSRLRSDKALAQESSEFAILQLEANRSKEAVEEIRSRFVGESGLLDFIGSFDVLRDQGVLTSFSFSSNKSVTDKTKNLGLPFVVEAVGDQAQIDNALSSVHGLPFLLRPVNIDIARSSADGLLSVRYGLVVYVNENINQD